MYCTNCGNYVSEELSFCSNCGTALRDVPDIAPDIAKESETAEPIAFPEFPELREPIAPAAPIPHAPPQPQKEKLFFGKGAFAFCLAVIAVLSIVSGMFIGLYINERNRSVNSGRGGTYHSKIG